MFVLEVALTCLLIFPTSSQVNNTATETLPLPYIPTEQKWIDKSVSTYAQENSSFSLPQWTEWSPWSKCRRCLQNRMKMCMNDSCEFTKVHQEKRCEKKRCKRKRKLEDFHVVMPEKSDGQRRYATPPQQIAAFNRRSEPEILAPNGGDWIKIDGDVIIGNDILGINPAEP
ncbi:hypothetical protein HHI36_006217 [Cryptolaemus montrouzieri]|uniref:Uncharacterized protein n=1 Tax=Cryptolaemus montrouzieri TaxID=559131 RepID=A0ABD2NXC3_9CUCU